MAARNDAPSMAQDEYDELSLLLGLDPARFCDPDEAEELQIEIGLLQETLLLDGPTNAKLAQACQLDIENGLRLLNAISL